MFDHVVLVASGFMAVWGVHRLLTLVHAWRATVRAAPARRGSPSLHIVTVQVPLYNEPHVAVRAVDAVCGLRHGHLAGFEVQILDDSTDETPALVAASVERWRTIGVDVTHLRRGGRGGYKAGALAWGLERARGDLIAIFDADFVPAPDFLEQVVPLFDEEERAPDVVQARWTHLNRGASWLTRAQAVLLDAHFFVEQHGRASRGRFLGFNGTAGVWRRSAIERAGGWGTQTLTEDLELSVRAWLTGCRFSFAGEVEVPAELPATTAALRLQQRRWARGGLETARLRLADVWATPRTLLEKVDVTLKLTQNAVHPLLFLFVAALPLAAIERTLGHTRPLIVDVVVATLGLGPVGCALLWSAHRAGVPPVRAVVDAALGIGLAAALSATCAAAALAGACGIGPSVFHRTPKDGGRDHRRSPSGGEVGWASVVVEATLGVLHLSAAALLTARGLWVGTPFLWLCGASCVMTAVRAVWERSSPSGACTSPDLVEEEPPDQRRHHGDTGPGVLAPGPVEREAEHRLVQQR